MPNPNRTDILIIQDRSGSMAGVTQATISGFNEFLKAQKEGPGEARLTLVQFDHETAWRYSRAPLADVQDLTLDTYVPRGSTALFDAAVNAIDNLGQQLAVEAEEDRPSQVIVVIQTDGYENASVRFRLYDLQARIQHQQDKYGWKFMFFGAGIDAYDTAASYGIGASTTAQYLGDVASTKGVYAVASASINRGRGGQSLDFTLEEKNSLAQNQK